MLDLIKGRRVEDALNTLMFTKKRIRRNLQAVALGGGERQLPERGKRHGCRPRPALREARHRQRRSAHEAYSSGPMGRAFRYQRRISHIEIALAEKRIGQRKTSEGAGAAAAKARK